jgi:hypothetical protein
MSNVTCDFISMDIKKEITFSNIDRLFQVSSARNSSGTCELLDLRLDSYTIGQPLNYFVGGNPAISYQPLPLMRRAIPFNDRQQTLTSA